ncbi:MAG TPA: aminopeptidase [Candidatus Excrementavichristensenella intestinipullorum]|nr:aminopeptidase [Candidatus Excrementavichristensenella intestinipullorum]
MRDPRITTLARNLVNHSCKVRPGDRVLIENTGLETGLVTALVEQVYQAGGMPFVWLKDPAVNRALQMGLTQEMCDLMAENEGAMMRQMQAYIGVRSGGNSSELSDVPADKQAMMTKHVWQKVHGRIRVPQTRWVVLRYPSPAMAQQAGMSTEAFEDYYFNVCCLDYQKMDRAMDALVKRMEAADQVRITGPGTDLTFSIKGIPTVKCAGELNIPDGEVYTAPVRESVNGVIQYNTPSLSGGFTYENIRLTFEQGKIVDAICNDTRRINQVLDTDPGARYVGEFAIGVNPYITKPMKDTLFDEKIAGSFHFTPGACYDDCPNGNHSAVHWDLVCIQTPEYGGGKMYFDGELIRENGLFVPQDLHCLNPENLG